MTPMARTWTPEELEGFQARIDAARAGDVGRAADLLRWIIVCLENEWPLPEPLSRYLIDAFQEITRTTPFDIEANAPPLYVIPKRLSDVSDFFRQHEKTRDANTALNLKRPRGRKRSSVRTFMEGAALAMAVNSEMEKGASWEQAVGAVADKMGVSDRTVSRAWQELKGPFYGR